jgi:hypothetical protein
MALLGGLFAGGCEDTSNPPPSAAPSTPLGGLTETPTSLAGRSAAAGRNTARLAEQGQEQASGLADELAGNAAGSVIGGIEFTVPTSWEKTTTGPMQAAAYRVGGDAQVVFFANIGGGVENNVNRWRTQVKTREGSPADAKVEKRTISGMPATVVSMEGVYTGMTGAGGAAAPIEDAAFRAVIYSGPAGDVFVRFTGPADVVRANEKAWETMILGAKKQ